jgi:membrane dipeptidase
MNDLGMIVDLSTGRKHVLARAASRKRRSCVAHSDAYALSPHFRNLKDEQIRALADHAGSSASTSIVRS